MSDYGIWNSPDEGAPTDFPQAIELDTHSGPRLLEWPEGVHPHYVLYRYIREWAAEILTDDNHWVRFELGRVNICRPITGYNYWFSERYRIVSPAVFDRDIAVNKVRRETYRKEMAECRDTCRGRARMRKYAGFVKSADATIAFYARRKEDLIVGIYYGD